MNGDEKGAVEQRRPASEQERNNGRGGECRDWVHEKGSTKQRADGNGGRDRLPETTKRGGGGGTRRKLVGVCRPRWLGWTLVATSHVPCLPATRLLQLLMTKQHSLEQIVVRYIARENSASCSLPFTISARPRRLQHAVRFSRVQCPSKHCVSPDVVHSPPCYAPCSGCAGHRPTYCGVDCC
jgi:hypothetical protein